MKPFSLQLKDNHTISELRKVHDQKASPSNFNFRMHGLHPLFGGNSDQLKTLYTNLGSGNNQVQLKYITGMCVQMIACFSKI